ALGRGSGALTSGRNAERLADALCRMRGAALKLGQMLSMQDESVVPGPLSAALERARGAADAMPREQLGEALAAGLGADWRAKFAEFEDRPCAAASIGQVHRAWVRPEMLAEPELEKGPGQHSSAHAEPATSSSPPCAPPSVQVAVKVQYPGVAQSIQSDVDNLLRLVYVSKLLPRGMYVENMARVAKAELLAECDYGAEAAAQARMAALVAAHPKLRGRVSVPRPLLALSGPGVLTTTWAEGEPLDRAQALGREERDALGETLLRLTLAELFDWRFMQTDPNWGNFVYHSPSQTLHMLDFGAAREFSRDFVRRYLRMVAACARGDEAAILHWSLDMGFLTGEEAPEMLDAHARAAGVVGMPFAERHLESGYDFAEHGEKTKDVTRLGSVMLKHRLTPPPDESYSLHRRLSGAILACIKLRANVRACALFKQVCARHDPELVRLNQEGLREDVPRELYDTMMRHRA
ncbi:hypothetical protein H632_c2043p0, partial [Helicosporidium sp. ATCC 50920]